MAHHNPSTHSRTDSWGTVNDSNAPSPYDPPLPPGATPPANAARPLPTNNESRQSGYFRSADYDEEDDVGFNVYDDFNNAGPRYAAQPHHVSTYSAADVYSATTPGTPLPPYGHGHHSRPSSSNLLYDSKSSPRGSAHYPYPPETPPATAGRKSHSTAALVAAPQRGGEWSEGEARSEKPKGPDRNGRRGSAAVDMNKPKWQRDREEKWERIKGKVTGIRITWKQGVFIVLFLIVALIMLLYFLLPRVPHFFFDTQSGPLTSSAPSDSLSRSFSRSPASFTFPATANLGVDAKSNWLPLKFKKLKLEMRLLDTGKLIGEGDMGGYSVPGRELSPFEFPFTFSYRGGNESDPTWALMYSACAHRWNGQADRPLLNLSLRIIMSIQGLVGEKSTSTQFNAIACPIELPGNAA